MSLYEEGTEQAKEASEILRRVGGPARQAKCLIVIVWALWGDKQLNAAAEAASHAIDLLPETGQQPLVCESHRVLGNIYRSQGATEEAIHHFEVAPGIASSLSIVNKLFWNHFSLAQLFFGGGKSSDAHAHLERAESHAVNNPYILARTSRLRAGFWYEQYMLEEARPEALRALNVFEKFGASDDVETGELLGDIDRELMEMDLDPVPPDESDDDGEFLLETMLLVVSINSPSSDSVTDLSPGPNDGSDVRLEIFG